MLGIDYGDARIGIAATDAAGIMAHPVETIDVKKTNSVERIAELVNTKNIQGLVLGLPLRMDGSEGEAVAKVRKFAESLQAKLPNLPLHYCDETFTTVVASGKLHQAGRKSKDQRNIIDQAAAVEILNSWLEWS